MKMYLLYIYVLLIEKKEHIAKKYFSSYKKIRSTEYFKEIKL